jgi:hypothetical protein
MQWEFETQLAAVEARTRHGCSGNTQYNADKVKPPKFDGFTSWTEFHCQFEDVAGHKDWTSCKKDTHLLTVL